MSEFYLVRRDSIADLSAFFGFLIGFLGAAPVAWPFLQVGFQTGEITKGFAYFLSIIIGAGVLCGALGLVVGRAGGWVWERGHRFLRAHRGGELPVTRSRSDAARVERDRAIVAALNGSPSVEVPGMRFDTAAPEPRAYAALLERAGLAADDDATLERALRRTTNVAAWHGHRLVGIARALTDGHRYAALAELVVDPEYRRRGIGKALVRRAGAAVQAPLSLMSETAACESLLTMLGSAAAGRALPYLAVLASLIVLPASGLQAQTVRDSAGVRLVRYTLRDRPLAVWRVDSTPLLEIGGDGREGPTEFAGIVGVARLSDGRVAVANAGSNEIRFFSPAGAFLRAVGRRGRGPGEFDRLTATLRTADTLIGIDAQNRIQVFAPDGKLLRGLERPALEGFTLARWIGLMPDGEGVVMAPEADASPSGRSTVWLGVARIGLDGSPRLLPGRYPGWAQHTPPGGRPAPIAYGPAARAALTRSRLWMGYGEEYILNGHDSAGRLVVRVVRDTRPEPVLDEDRKRYVNALLAANANAPPAVRAQLEDMARLTVFAGRFAAFGPFLASEADALWVNNQAPRGSVYDRFGTPDRASHWSVFAADGRWLADVTLPPRFLPLDIGRAYVAGVSRGADDVERVTIFRLML